MPGVEKGKIVFGNKMEPLLSRRPAFFFFFFFWLKLAACDCISVAIAMQSGDITLNCHGDEDALTNNEFHHHCAGV